MPVGFPERAWARKGRAAKSGRSDPGVTVNSHVTTNPRVADLAGDPFGELRPALSKRNELTSLFGNVVRGIGFAASQAIREYFTSLRADQAGPIFLFVPSAMGHAGTGQTVRRVFRSWSTVRVARKPRLVVIRLSQRTSKHSCHVTLDYQP
jgi:hypothetical protein